jgi:acetate kinase
MVTGGATPLEGLPGLTTCGEIDPALVLTLGDRLGWGPEQVDRLLSRESGLLGLAGRPVTLDEVFFQDQPDLRLAREVMTYRILLACGAAVAALGGLDALVFSGRFARAGEVLGPVLVERLLPRRPEQSRGISTEFFHESLARVVADEAIRAAAGALTRA